MNTIRIKQIFQSKFDYQTYCNEIVHSIFGCNDVAVRPELLDTTAEGDECNYIGRMTDTNGRELGFFYTRVASGSDVRRKRIGLRKMIAPYLKFDVDAAIAVFADENRWRLSYICDLKEGVTNAKRFSYILGDEQGQYKTPLERLDNIYAKRGRFVLNDLRDAFSVDALSDEFFDEYHVHYDRIVAELARQGKSGAVYHDYVKKLMGRIVFLHFLQKKGWLCGDTNFMLNTFSQSNRKNDYLESVLEPLFFGILNTEPAKREQVFSKNSWQQRWVSQWSNIPYLNGGLFERDAVDDLRIVLPENIFSNLFSFLASYNFTVDENDPDDAEIGVDPEMLGKIFESLLEDNKAKGAFYTPKEIVRYMCKESLIAYLASKLPDVDDSTVRTFVEHHEMQSELEPCRDTLSQALRNVKICDPAIGSGAFPMGLLNELWRCREALEPTESRVALKKEIIENNIYGVDIERGAIDIARLRFWLSIVVDSEKAEPLPNFDYKFMQGNSLIESYQGCDLSRISGRTVGRPSTSTQLVIGLDSHLSRKNLQRLLREYFSVTDHQQKANMRQAINDEVKTLIRESLGGTTASLAKLEKLDPSANQEFFLWHTWFKDIFDGGGFDIVIGNPPYIQLQADGGKLGDLYKNADFETYVRTGDIYSLFYEQGWNILNKGGHLCFITSNKWMRSGYGEKTRSFFTTKTNPILLVDLGANVFENASVDTNILLFAKSKNAGNTIGVTFNADKENLEYLGRFVQKEGVACSFSGNDSWVILSPIEQSIKRKIETKGTPLKDWNVQINYGIKTGCNDAFVITTEKRNEILSNCKSEEERKRTDEIIRPILRGRDIQRYSYKWAGLWLINTHNGVRGKMPRIDINEYPAVKQHLDRFWNVISTRADKGDTPYNLRNCAYLEDFMQPKVVWTAVNSEYRFCYVPSGMMINNALFMMTGMHVYTLLGVFNSPILKKYLTMLTGDFYQYGAKELFDRIPVIQVSDEIDALFKIHIESMNEEGINKLVFQLYNLTEEEIAVIEQ